MRVDDKPQALLFFNESPADESYHFPDRLAKTKLWSRAVDGKETQIATKSIDTEDRVGLIGPLPDEKSPVLETSQQYGIYGTALLDYHAKHIRGTSPDEINAAGTSKELKLELIPKVKNDEVELTVLWDGKPLAGADVTFMAGDKDSNEKKTDDDGHATFKLANGGLIGVLANTMEKDKSGDLDGKPYNGVMHYASLTFNLPTKGDVAEKKASSPKTKSAPAPSAEASILPPLPEPVASFGGVVSDGWLYVYGGHTGEEHEHSAANLSKHFRRIQLEGGKEWQELPMETALQGLPLVAHGGKIYRVGGLDIRNPTTKDTEDLHSSAEFAEYDPGTNKWTALTPLPAARSSHNAVVIGDKLYVAGGWRLEGKPPGAWEPDALVYDFTKPENGWQKLPEPEFKRRALGMGVWKDQLFVLGGMDEKTKISMDVYSFNPATKKWTKGPSLPGAGMAGFGVSAWNLDGSLYECGIRGVLYRLNDSGSAWEEAGRIQTPRFFHQLLPAPHGGLMVVGGASINGHLATIERVEMSGSPAAKTGS
ncbi:MAG TPA: kelch repeat-containing protein [Lacipirellulaceae bacterium]|nr:kelch repeat-containing protein [Lacipirellulaceae bacterium]